MSTEQSPSFAALLRHYRRVAGLTQEELAERAGLSRGAIDTLERGARRAPRKETIALLAEALALTASERAELEAAVRQHRLALPLPIAPSTPGEAQLTLPEAPLAPDAGPPHPSASPTAEPLVQASPPLAPRTRRELVAGVVSGLLVIALLGGVLASKGVLGSSASAGQTPRTLCIATDLPTSGSDTARGKPLEHAINLAVMQNQALGKGYTLKVINYDDEGPTGGGGDPQRGVHNVSDMVQHSCIVGMVGPHKSLVAIAEMPIAANAGLVMVSPDNTKPSLTLRQYAEIEGVDFDLLHPKGKKISYFRISPNDVGQGIVDADFTFQALGARSVYVVNDSFIYGEEVVGGFTERFQVEGGTIAGTGRIPPGNTYIIGQVAAKVVAARPDAVFYGGRTDSGAGLLKAQLVNLGFTGPLVGGDGIANDDAFVKQAGASAATGTYGSVGVRDLSTFTSGAAAQFIRDYSAQYPVQELSPLAADAYDAAMVLITAIKHLINADQAVTRAAMIDQVQHILYTGVIGPISFDSNGDIAHGVFSLYTIQDGRWVFAQLLSA